MLWTLLQPSPGSCVLHAFSLMDDLSAEIFHQRLLLLAAQNEEGLRKQELLTGTTESTNGAREIVDCKQHGVTNSGGCNNDANDKQPEDIEDMLKDLLTALHKERPPDPLTEEQIAAVEASAVKSLEEKTIQAEIDVCDETQDVQINANLQPEPSQKCDPVRGPPDLDALGPLLKAAAAALRVESSSTSAD